MSWYDQIQSASIGGGNRRMGLGNYVVCVQCIREHKGQQGGTFFIADFDILGSDNPNHPVGSEGGMGIRLDGRFPQSSLGDVKGFAAAVLGMEKDDPRVAGINSQVIQGLFHPSMWGSVLQLNVWAKPPKTPGKEPFNKFAWKPIIEGGQPKRLPVRPRAPQQPQQPQGYGYGPPPQQQPQGYGQPQPYGQPGGNGFGPPPGYGPPPAAPAPSYGPPMGYGAPSVQAPMPQQNPYAALQQPQAPVQYGAPNPAMPAPTGQPWQPPQFGGAAAHPSPNVTPSGSYAPPASVPFPPAGWQPHPQDPSRYWKGNTVLTEPELRALQAAGQA